MVLQFIWSTGSEDQNDVKQSLGGGQETGQIGYSTNRIRYSLLFIYFFFFFNFYFIFKLYITVLDLPNIKMNPPQVKILF